jgi:hypothetical protein
VVENLEQQPAYRTIGGKQAFNAPNAIKYSRIQGSMPSSLDLTLLEYKPGLKILDLLFGAMLELLGFSRFQDFNPAIRTPIRLLSARLSLAIAMMRILRTAPVLCTGI